MARQGAIADMVTKLGEEATAENSRRGMEDPRRVGAGGRGAGCTQVSAKEGEASKGSDGVSGVSESGGGGNGEETELLGAGS